MTPDAAGNCFHPVKVRLPVCNLCKACKCFPYMLLLSKKRSNNVLEDCHALSHQHWEVSHALSSTVCTVFTTQSVPHSSLIIHSKNKGFPLFGQVMHFAIRKAYTWSESCLQPMCASEALRGSCEKSPQQQNECLWLLLSTKNASNATSNQIYGGTMWSIWFARVVFKMYVWLCVELSSVKKGSKHMFENMEVHTYRSASRRWGLVACVIAVRALSHSQPWLLKPCASVHFCFALLSICVWLWWGGGAVCPCL